jgi:hypothetical protein
MLKKAGIPLGVCAMGIACGSPHAHCAHLILDQPTFFLFEHIQHRMQGVISPSHDENQILAFADTSVICMVFVVGRSSYAKELAMQP